MTTDPGPAREENAALREALTERLRAKFDGNDVAAALLCYDRAVLAALAQHVTARRQIGDLHEGHVSLEASKHQPEPGGCTCGFCAYSSEHVAVMVWRDLIAPHVTARVEQALEVSESWRDHNSALAEKFRDERDEARAQVEQRDAEMRAEVEYPHQRKGLNPFLPDAPVRKTFTDERVAESLDDWARDQRMRETWRDGDTNTYRYRANLLEAASFRLRAALAQVEQRDAGRVHHGGQVEPAKAVQPKVRPRNDEFTGYVRQEVLQETARELIEARAERDAALAREATARRDALAPVLALLDRVHVVQVQSIEGMVDAPVIWPHELRAAVESPDRPHRAPWADDDHPPHQWPIGSADGWRQGFGCPTVWCKGAGSQRESPDRPERKR